MTFYNQSEWMKAAINAQYDIEHWGNGSADAYDNGEVVGSWTSFYDLDATDRVAKGWLDLGEQEV